MSSISSNPNFQFLVVIFMTIIMLYGCAEPTPKSTENVLPIQEDTILEPDDFLPIKENENKDRDVWQKPNIVIDLLGDLSEKTVADIGAGTGYFTFRFALKAEKVIAVDIENQFLEIINTFKRNLPGDVQERIETRLATPNDPLLQKEEVDLIVIINTVGYIDGRKRYLKNLLPSLKQGGKLVIVDYKMKNLPLEIAPPIKDRVPLYVIQNELEETGYVDIISNDTSLDYQYVVFASKALE